jgi:hypothetical protein
MRMPGFTAEASLQKLTGQHRSASPRPIEAMKSPIVPAVWRYMRVCEARSGECYWAWVWV